jgi:hypothetical protein
MAPLAARLRCDFLEVGAILGRFARDRLFWPEKGRLGRVSALLH